MEKERKISIAIIVYLSLWGCQIGRAGIKKTAQWAVFNVFEIGVKLINAS